MKSGAAWCRLVQIGTTWCLVPPELAQPENFPLLDEVKVTVKEDPPCNSRGNGTCLEDI